MLSVIDYDYSMIRKTDLQYRPMFIFRRLKINHDSHELILEFGIVQTMILFYVLYIQQPNCQLSSNQP